jgi:hypothetical protein
LLGSRPPLVHPAGGGQLLLAKSDRVVRPSPACMVLVLALATSACGHSDDRAQVRSVTAAFVGAYTHDDGETACAQLSRDTRRELESEEGKSCRRAVTELPLDAGAVSGVEVFVTNAKVGLRTGESMFLSKQSVGWRISAVGCRPQGGKPADRPFDGELQA